MKSRRDFLKLAGAAAGAGSLAGLAGCASTVPSKARVVVIGGGFGGATAAKYIRLWDPSIDVVLVERESAFISCPISNLVLAGYSNMQDITPRLRRAAPGTACRWCATKRSAIDAAKKTVRAGARRRHRLRAPGRFARHRFQVRRSAGLRRGDASGPRAARLEGGPPDRSALRRQLEQMRDGGVYVLSIPLAPYRCPPGPYERASMVAAYFKQAKPRSKVLVLDANPDVTSKGGLFKAAWKDLYPGILEYRGNAKAVGVDAATMTVKLEVEDVKGDVLNVVPPHRAGDIAQKAGLITTNNRWCDVDWRTMESTKPCQASTCWATRRCRRRRCRSRAAWRTTTPRSLPPRSSKS